VRSVKQETLVNSPAVTVQLTDIGLLCVLISDITTQMQKFVENYSEINPHVDVDFFSLDAEQRYVSRRVLMASW